MKFLIIRFSSIGDIVLTTPVIRCLKTQFKNAEVHYLSKTAFSSVLKDNPYIDKLYLIDSKVAEVSGSLKQEKYDVVIDLHHNFRSLQVKNAIKTKSFSFQKLNYKKWLLVNLKVNRLPAVHIVDRYLETIKSFGIVNDGKGLDFFLSEEDEINLSDLPLHFQNGYLALVLGGTYYTKQIPMNKLSEICERSRLPLVLLGGKQEMRTADNLSQKYGDKVFNACGKFSLKQSAFLIKHALKVFTSDTGLMHIAAAFKKDIVSIWGNTIPEFGMSPYLPGENSIMLENKSLGCRPCSKLGYSKCPKSHFRCMKELSIPEHIFN